MVNEKEIARLARVGLFVEALDEIDTAITKLKVSRPGMEPGLRRLTDRSLRSLARMLKNFKTYKYGKGKR